MDHTLFPNFVLLRDFNIDYNNTSHPFHHHLLGFMSTLCLTQVVSEPTHLSSHSSTLIDLVLLSQPPLLISCHTVPPLANSDHHGIHLKLKTHKQNSNMHVSRRKLWRYTHADFPKPNYLLDELDLGHIFVSPNKPFSYKTLRNYIVMALREPKQAFFVSLQSTNKQFWGKIKQINNTKTTTPTLTSSNNVLAATTNDEKANCLNKHFSSCFDTALPQLSQSEI